MKYETQIIESMAYFESPKSTSDQKKTWFSLNSTEAVSS